MIWTSSQFVPIAYMWNTSGTDPTRPIQHDGADGADAVALRGRHRGRQNDLEVTRAGVSGASRVRLALFYSLSNCVLTASYFLANAVALNADQPAPRMSHSRRTRGGSAVFSLCAALIHAVHRSQSAGFSRHVSLWARFVHVLSNRTVGSVIHSRMSG